MLQFINNNAVLATGIFSILSALITAVVALTIDKRKNKLDSVRILTDELIQTRKQLDDAQKELACYVSIEQQEKNIDKRTGAIYSQIMPDGHRRDICGYCWETKHITIPLAVEIEEDYKHLRYYSGHCSLCGSNCIENIEDDIPYINNHTYQIEDCDEQLPF